MPTTTITTKGQMTLPKEIRDALGLKAGDQLDVSIQERRIVMVPRSYRLEDIVSFLPSKPSKRLTLADMDAIVRAKARERNR
jgi:antitoxin PrlF